MSVLVTGASGFIGGHLLEALKSAAQSVSLRDPGWPKTIARHRPSAIIHLAGYAHGRGSEERIQKVNVCGTKALAEEAVRCGVKRFIFLSTIKVNGEATHYGCPFTPSDLPAPQDPYGISKHEAEVGLREIARTTGMQVVIIRPTLVYGKGAKGNFKSLMKLVASGLPLPLAFVHNFRSFVGIDNLVDFIITCLEHPAAANETFLVSDGEDLSTPDLIRRMARAMNRPARLLPVPVWALQAGASLLGKGDAVQRLCGNLQVDISKSRALLGWKPRVSVDEGLRKAMSGV